MFSWLFGTNRRAAWAPRRRPASRCRPLLETLEDRLTPAGTYTWHGGLAMFPNDWTKPENWGIVGGNHAYPGENNSMDDLVVFDNTATADCWLNNNVML